MTPHDDRRELANSEAESGVDRLEAARALLAAIDSSVFPEAREIPFYEQSVLIRRAVMRLLGDD